MSAHPTSSDETPVPPDPADRVDSRPDSGDASPGESDGLAVVPVVPVVAVLVCHDGESFLPRTLEAIAGLDPAPATIVAVDTGSTDSTGQLLATELAEGGVDRVLTLDADAGFAEAVHAGVEAGPAADWLWILHDDSAPEPDALAVLVERASEQPSVAVWGPKVLGWDEPRRLLEIGVSISSSGRRYTGLESREQDQGQYDGQRDVLAVGSAGMFVRREVWSDLGGFERSLPFFREDVDFGWRVNMAGHRVTVTTDAVVHHAEAMARGRRAAAVSDPHAVDRSSALFTLLANGRRLTWPFRWLWLTVQTLLRAVGFVLGKAPREAAAEMSALGSVLLRPGRILKARRARRRWRSASARSLRSLFPPAGQQFRHTMETVAGSLTLEADVAPSTVLESGPVSDDLDSFTGASSGRLRRMVRRPGVILFGLLLVVQLLAWRGLYREGVLNGGALLPMPTGASDVWESYIATWHVASLGSATMAHPSSAVLGVLATLLLGHASWVVPVVLVVGPPVAGVLAYQVTRSFGLSSRLRLVLGVAYALNPVTLAATAQGRWTTVVVLVLLPLAGVALARALGLGKVPASGRAAALSALLLGIIVSLSPAMLVLVVVLAVVVMIWSRGKQWRAAGAMVAGPVILLLPWWGVALADPVVLLLEPGVRMSADGEQPWHAVFFDPGGWWSLPWWVGVGITVAALAATLRAAQVRPVRLALVMAAIALGWALVLESVSVTPANSALAVAPWSGSVLLVVLAASMVAAAIAARGVRNRMSRATFTWRQPALALVTAMAVASPVVWALLWLGHGASGPLDRSWVNPLPAFVQAQSVLPEQIRTLVLRSESGRLAYTVLRARDAHWGDVENAPTAEQLATMDEVVADLASGRGTAPVDELTDRAVQYVLAVPPVDDDLEVALDSAPGLLRIANPGEASLWRIERATGRVRVEVPDDELAVLTSAVPDDPAAASVDVPAGDDGRLLELAELADDSWTATDDTGETLEVPPSAEWAQRFVVGSDGGTIDMAVENPVRQWLIWIQVALVFVLVVLALPGRAREDEEAV